MIHVGLTGGIGSGKSTVATFFHALGIPIYDSDSRARALMELDPQLQKGLTEMFGSAAYVNGKLNRKYIADRVFNNRELLQALNRLVHPMVRQDFLDWAQSQEAPYVIQEAAILFENGGYQHLDYNILVVASPAAREERVMRRDGLTQVQVRARMANQWSDEKKIPMADFVITNNVKKEAHSEVLKIHKKLLQLA